MACLFFPGVIFDWLAFHNAASFSFGLIHVLVVTLVVAAGHVVEPVLVVEVPAHRLFDAFFKLQRGLPAQLVLELAAVDGIACIVTRAVGDVGNEVEILALGTPQQAVDRANEHFHDVDVSPLVETAYVVGLGNLALVENHIDGARVVFDVEPVAHVKALAVHGQRLAMTYIVDKERNEFFRKLVRPIVVAAIGDDGGQAVGVVKCPHKVVAAGLAGRVGRMRSILGGFQEELLPVGMVVLR